MLVPQLNVLILSPQCRKTTKDYINVFIPPDAVKPHSWNLAKNRLLSRALKMQEIIYKDFCKVYSIAVFI